MEILILTVIILAIIQLWVIGIFINSILIEVLEKEKSQKIQKNIQWIGYTKLDKKEVV